MDPLSLASAVSSVQASALKTAETLGYYLRITKDGDQDLFQIQENMQLLLPFLIEIRTIFLDSDNSIPEIGQIALKVCTARAEVLRNLIQDCFDGIHSSKPRRILASFKHPKKKVKSAFDSFKDSVGILRDIATMSMTHSIIQQQSRLEIETLYIRNTTEMALNHLQHLDSNFQRPMDVKTNEESGERSIIRSQPPMNNTNNLVFPGKAGELSNTQYHIEDHNDPNYLESLIKERKFLLETKVLTLQSDITIFTAYLLPKKLDTEERLTVYARCKLDTGSDVNLIDRDLIYNNNFQHLIHRVPETNRKQLKGFGGGLWTPDYEIRLEFYVLGAMKRRNADFFVLPDADFEILIGKEYYHEIQEASAEQQNKVRMLTAPDSLTLDQLALQSSQQASQKLRNRALKKLQDQRNREERAHKRLQPPANPALSTGGRAWTLADDHAGMPPPMAGSSRGSLASVESRGPVVGDGGVLAVPDVPDDVRGGSSTAQGS
ncbi:hypothetical protein ACMFMG_002667 [Clarireedia jacksonii]